MMWWNGGGWGWLVMSASMLVFWGLVIWGVVSVVGSSRGPSSGAGRPTDPERILKERFARGEIDAEEYEQRREVLRR
jgi:putative membrane protein